MSTDTMNKFQKADEARAAKRRQSHGVTSVAVARNNVVIWPKIVYNQGCQSVGTQGDQNQDSLTIFSSDGAIATGSVTNFLSTLV